MSQTANGTPSPRSLSDVQPANNSLSLGNYFGTQVNCFKMQQNFDAYFLRSGPARAYHAIRSRGSTPVDLRNYRVGSIDPDISTVFVQSHVLRHFQLAWVSNCITDYGEVAHMTQFKEKSVKRGTEGNNIGLLICPMLITADILFYDITAVSIGENQYQGLALMRDLAQRSNARYNETFVIPETHITGEMVKIMLLQESTVKISISADNQNNNLIMLEEPKVNTKKIKSVVTGDDNFVRYNLDAKSGYRQLAAYPLHALRQRAQRAGRALRSEKTNTAYSRPTSRSCSSAYRYRSRRVSCSCSATWSSWTVSSPSVPSAFVRLLARSCKMLMTQSLS